MIKVNRIISSILLLGVVVFIIQLVRMSSNVECENQNNFISDIFNHLEYCAATTKDIAASISTDDTYDIGVEEITNDEPNELIEPVECSYYINLSDEEIYEFATLVYLESGTESFECQCAVASVVVNRMTVNNMSLKEVIYEKNQFSPAYLISKSKPNESTIAAVNKVVKEGPTLPTYVTYFRAGYYHNWSNLIQPFKKIDRVYFSYDVRLKEDK